MNKSYRLDKMSDMLAIPEDRFDVFLTELKEWHKIANQTKQMLDTLGKAVGESQPAVVAGMTWHDDGETNKKVVIRATPTNKDSKDNKGSN